jgi:hypothetical protein
MFGLSVADLLVIGELRSSWLYLLVLRLCSRANCVDGRVAIITTDLC